MDRQCKDDEIKKSYRKLAVKVHPDKNKAPHAQEAFKKIAKAYDCLINKEKREHYDQYGEDQPQSQRRGRGGQGGHGGYEYDDINPEDIFFSFFGNNAFNGGDIFFNGQRVRTRRQQQPHPNQQRQ